MKKQKQLGVIPLTEKELQREREHSVIRHIHNGVQEQKGKNKKEKTKKFLLNMVLPQRSQLEIAEKVRENAEQTLLDLVNHTSKAGMHRISNVVLIKVILVKQTREQITITENTILELLQKTKKELIEIINE